MTQDWIGSLRKEYDAMHPSESRGQTSARDAFARIQAELRTTAERLSKEFRRKFKAGHLEADESIWLLDMEGAGNPWTGTAFRLNEQTGTIVTDPSANFSSIPGDHHEFTLDPRSGQFKEKGQIVPDSELVRRALDQFLKNALGLS
jgi:hypothetical protein